MQSQKVQRDCLDYCFVTSMSTTGISGISDGDLPEVCPASGLQRSLGIFVCSFFIFVHSCCNAALQSMIGDYFPSPAEAQGEHVAANPAWSCFCKIIYAIKIYQVQSILDNLQRENGRREMLKSVM